MKCEPGISMQKTSAGSVVCYSPPIMFLNIKSKYDCASSLPLLSVLKTFLCLLRKLHLSSLAGKGGGGYKLFDRSMKYFPIYLSAVRALAGIRGCLYTCMCHFIHSNWQTFSSQLNLFTTITC